MSPCTLYCALLALSSCVQSPSLALAAHALRISRRWSACSLSFKHSCCVLSPVPAAAHTKRLFLLTIRNSGSSSSKLSLASMTVAVWHSESRINYIFACYLHYASSYACVLWWSCFQFGPAFFRKRRL